MTLLMAVAATQYIGYTYDTTKSGDLFTNRLQLTSMTYPSSKTLTYDYDAIGNVTAIKGVNIRVRSF